MKEIMFPELSEKKQQSIYRAWAGSRSDPNYREDIPNYDMDNILIISNGSRDTVPNEWLNEIVITSDGGYTNSNSGGSSDSNWSNGDFAERPSSGDSHYNISNDSFIDFASGEGSDATNNEIAKKIPATAGLAVGAAGTMLEGFDKTIQKIGFTPTKLASVGKGLGVASRVIAVAEVSSGQRDWNDSNRFNAIATGLGIAAVIIARSPSIILGGLSIMVGLVAAAYSSQSYSMNYDY
ncbi:hypothetical protein HX025_11705 [Myroides odoratimimus]|uniref:hypothetical protein n=1 Tax=Myroides odoratimimus TaxID=76832 RepID=UPI00257814C6|nr:hypothetical protein [Myroides odoratimimus]MDM1457308.1 hypothetical protein [Myroides odoratimimus]